MTREGLLKIRLGIISLVVLFAFASPQFTCSGGEEEGEPGPLAIKAGEYDSWHEAHHQPFYGATVEVEFKDESLSGVERYGGLGDSTIWTGTYLASQSFRYAVTKDPQAKANAIKIAGTLHNHLKVTGRPGFIARYRAPVDPTTVSSCDLDDENCHIVTSGEFAGDVWLGNTSRDQYTGWFFGYALAYDLVDDPGMKQMIREDVKEVIDALVEQGYKIIDIDGIQTTAGPDVLPPMRENWHLIAAHMIDEPSYWESFEFWADPSKEEIMKLSSISFFNKYAQYYGNNLAHQNTYNLLRLCKLEGYEDAYKRAKDLFDSETHKWVHLTHNAFFEGIHLSQASASKDDPELTNSIIEDLTSFRDAPNRDEKVSPPDAPLDPVSILLYSLQQAIPELADIMGTVNPQALDAYPVQYQCSTDFLWQRNPFSISCGGGNLANVNPGVDYLAAYWLARYHGIIGPEL